MAALDTFMAKQPDTAKEVDKSKEETDSLKTDSSMISIKLAPVDEEVEFSVFPPLEPPPVADV